MDEITTHEITEKAGIDFVNVMLVGECSAGKSSFFNSVESVYVGNVTSTAEAGVDQEGSLTKQVCTLHNCIVIVKAPSQFRQYEIDSSNIDEEPIKFRYCDTMGIESTRGLTASDFGKIMDGHIEDTAKVH